LNKTNQETEFLTEIWNNEQPQNSINFHFWCPTPEPDWVFLRAEFCYWVGRISYFWILVFPFAFLEFDLACPLFSIWAPAFLFPSGDWIKFDLAYFEILSESFADYFWSSSFLSTDSWFSMWTSLLIREFFSILIWGWSFGLSSSISKSSFLTGWPSSIRIYRSFFELPGFECTGERLLWEASIIPVSKDLSLPYLLMLSRKTSKSGAII